VHTITTIYLALPMSISTLSPCPVNTSSHSGLVGGRAAAMLTVVMNVTTRTQSVAMSSLNILHGTKAGHGTWYCCLHASAKSIDAEQCFVEELIALRRMPHTILVVVNLQPERKKESKKKTVKGKKKREREKEGIK